MQWKQGIMPIVVECLITYEQEAIELASGR